jgi:hypothetical protein
MVVAGAAALAVAVGAWGCGGSDKNSAGSANASTPKPSGIASSQSKKSAVVWAVGDATDGGEYAPRVGRLVARGKPDRFLYLGDVYEDGTKEDFKNNYAPVFGRLATITAPTPGNHEWGQRDEGYRPYWKAIFGKDIPDYYTFSLAGWQFLGLNSEAPHDEASPQVRWLRSNLPGDGTCRLAFWHRPRYSFGDHGDQPDIQPLWNALRGRAALILNGHEHNMERFAPRDGITELVAGAGGRGIYPIEPSERAQLAFGNGTNFGALRLKLRPGRADYRFVAVDGSTLDSGTVHCDKGSGRESQPVSAY